MKTQIYTLVHTSMYCDILYDCIFVKHLFEGKFFYEKLFKKSFLTTD